MRGTCVIHKINSSIIPFETLSFFKNLSIPQKQPDLNNELLLHSTFKYILFHLFFFSISFLFLIAVGIISAGKPLHPIISDILKNICFKKGQEFLHFLDFI